MIYPFKLARGLVRRYLKTTGYWGITLPPFGIYLLAEHSLSERLQRHELAHWEQAKRMGTFKFYAVYLWYLVRHGYAKHPMELEARAAEY